MSFSVYRLKSGLRWMEWVNLGVLSTASINKNSGAFHGPREHY